MTKAPMAVVTVLLLVLSAIATARVPSRLVSGEEKICIPTLTLGADEIRQCWQSHWPSIMGVDSCVGDLTDSILSPPFMVSAKCCKTIEAIGEPCFTAIFSYMPFNAGYPSRLKSFCEAVPNTDPLSGKAPTPSIH